MSQKNHAPGPVPPGNRPKGPHDDATVPPVDEAGDQHGTGDSEHDPKRGVGGYTGKGEAPFIQPDKGRGT